MKLDNFFRNPKNLQAARSSSELDEHLGVVYDIFCVNFLSYAH
jgi:hypothetical protein